MKNFSVAARGKFSRSIKVAIVASLAFGGHALSAQDSAGGAAEIGRQQYVAQMDADFARLDANGDGDVTGPEIAATQQQAAQAEALRQNRRVFDQLDADGDGTLAPAEFAQLANPAAVPINAAPLLERFDTDRNGIITLVEYRIATQASFDQIDTDRDGTITPVEMRSAGIVQ